MSRYNKSYFIHAPTRHTCYFGMLSLLSLLNVNKKFLQPPDLFGIGPRNYLPLRTRCMAINAAPLIKGVLSLHNIASSTRTIQLISVRTGSANPLGS